MFLAAAVVLSLGACRFESRVPVGTVRDDATVLGSVRALYAAMERGNTDEIDSLVMPTATALLGTSDGPALVPWRAMMSAGAGRIAAPELRVIRTEIRIDGDLAAVRVTVAGRSGPNTASPEASDLLTFARMHNRWLLAHASFGSWHGGGLP